MLARRFSRILILVATAAPLLAGCVNYSPRPHEAEPAPFVFRLGPGDRVQISVWKEDLATETEIRNVRRR